MFSIQCIKSFTTMTLEKQERNKRKTREWVVGVVIDAFMISRIDDWGSNISFMPILYTSYVFGNRRPLEIDEGCKKASDLKWLSSQGKWLQINLLITFLVYLFSIGFEF